MSDIVKRIREVFDDTPEIVDMCDESYEGQEIAEHLQGLYEAALEAANKIERLENQLSHIIEHNNPQIEQANSYFKSLEEELDRCNKIIDEYEEEDNKLYAENQRLRAALRGIDAATISHVDGRDLLDELHPRGTLDIKRRIDGKETWFEGDWLSNLRDARNAARAALAPAQEKAND
jgi:DNA repair exonuclease SbcCD ATPase subunit